VRSATKVETQPAVVFVVVAYHPKQTIRPFAAASDQAWRTIIVDNTPTSETPALLSPAALQELPALAPVELIRLGANRGIAAALNVGCQRAFASGAEFVFTMDQDTTLEPKAVEELIAAWERRESRAETRGRTGLLGPVHFDRDSGHVSRELGSLSVDFLERDYLMTSGNLLHRSVWDRVGPFREDFFIEYVDHDYGLRCWSQGLAVGLVPKAQMAHTLGEVVQHDWLFGRFRFFSHNYAPVRRYYRARNRVLLYAQHWRVRSGRWILQDLGFAGRDLAKIILVEDGKLRKIWAFAEGTFDAFTGVRGAHPGSLAERMRKRFRTF
jgi:rhamnosyltransferase